MDNKLVVKNLDGNDLEINVIEIIEDIESQMNYICYTIEGYEEVYASKLVESDNEYSLEKITEEEKKVIEKVMSEGE